MESNSYNKSSLSQISQENPLSSEVLPSEASSSAASSAPLSRTDNPPSGIMSPESTAMSQANVLGRLSHGTAERLHQAAASVRDRSARLTQGAVAEKFAQRTATAMDGAAQYIETTSARSVQEALADQIKRHPWITMGVGVTLGVWLGRSLKR